MIFNIEDVRVDTYRPGSVGPSDMTWPLYAIRMTHIPTGLVEDHRATGVFSMTKKKKELMDNLKKRVEAKK